MAIDPFRRRSGVDVKPLEDRDGEWRLRVGHYRGIYVVEGDVVRFVRFERRKTAYR